MQGYAQLCAAYTRSTRLEPCADIEVKGHIGTYMQNVPTSECLGQQNGILLLEKVSILLPHTYV